MICLGMWSTYPRVTHLSKYSTYSALSDEEMQRLDINPEAKAECMEDVNSELFVYYSIFYHLIEVLKSYDGFAEELSASVLIALNHDNAELSISEL